ncbi:uncharacterized protein I206_102152 [Kwoniella pini CBS 10737]|uniref:Uncharacterized protein n=1 Tax=Kwoniella pini CBS 10737 TaxID=1296096 RepID=A0A1B9HUN8_9TREE|nr:uncharacterized protein I206_06754 [Kwoniella pini CBS 10737]OCF46980.1 hypothetical protein I206_06754 [Kwoniella pini CBS 10737]
MDMSTPQSDSIFSSSQSQRPTLINFSRPLPYKWNSDTVTTQSQNAFEKPVITRSSSSPIERPTIKRSSTTPIQSEYDPKLEIKKLKAGLSSLTCILDSINRPQSERRNCQHIWTNNLLNNQTTELENTIIDLTDIPNKLTKITNELFDIFKTSITELRLNDFMRSNDNYKNFEKSENNVNKLKIPKFVISNLTLNGIETEEIMEFTRKSVEKRWENIIKDDRYKIWDLEEEEIENQLKFSCDFQSERGNKTGNQDPIR